MNLFTHFFARGLSKAGHAKRKANARQRYQDVHDELRARLGMPPIVWKR